jgi:hypothetical protein
MRAGGHIVMGGVASFAFYPFPSVPGIFFWLSSVLIDLDHYLDYIYHNGFTDFRIKNMFRYHDVLRRLWGRPEFLNLSPFHTAEFALTLYIFSLWTDSAWLEALFWGLVFHFAIDTAYLYRKKALTVRAYSVIEYVIRKKRLLELGLSPGAVYAEAVRNVKETGEE